MNIRQYKLLKRIGGGRFGEIFCCVETETNLKYAIKLELRKAKHQQLLLEAKIYEELQCEEQFIQPGIPKMISYGEDGDFNFIILDLLGYSLDNLFNQCNKKFSLKTVLVIADQMLQILEFIHSRGFLHLNLKPSDIMIGCLENAHKIYLIDFGLALKYFEVQQQNKFNEQQPSFEKLRRTSIFSSVDSHFGKVQGRRDDLESLGYIMIYFLRGSLPWQSTYNAQLNHEQDKMVYLKSSMTIETLCNDLPEEFQEYFNQIKKINFNEKLGYRLLRQLLQGLFQKMDFKQDNIYDWNNIQNLQN
ncbi:unnamed protein product [Paramecium primaurelia]|uniref:Casein kinase I n=1 Tax=Paramecium primaurelia TaxID=5886 RepID=A0A8S1MNY8_PARPR|nr:unnamed protein product [Paramecium primaurelia]